MTRFATSHGGRAAEPLSDPERLTEGKYGRLLRDGQRELADGLDQAAAFRRLTERLSTSDTVHGSRRVYWLAPAALLVLAVFAVAPSLLRWLQPSPATTIVAEDVHGYRAKPLAAAPSTEASEVPPAPAATRLAEAKPASDAKRVVHPVQGLSSTGLSGAPPPSAPTAPPPPPAPAPIGSAEPAPAASSEVGAAPDCLSWARRGQTRDAEACFLKRAEGSGLGAEMALYEVARLRRDVLGDANGALGALAEYRARFPAGSLRREADMSQLELLVQLGRSAEALKQSEELLSSSASGERAAELHLLRGHILRKTRSFAAAEREYALAEKSGARRGEVTYFHALCLEALGREADAAALFSQYLEQPQQSYADDARRRLERLKP